MRSLIHKYFHYLLSPLPGAMRRAAHPGPSSRSAAGARQFLNERKAVAAVEFAMIGAPSWPRTQDRDERPGALPREAAIVNSGNIYELMSA